jgi:hypothetical protein
MPEPTSAAPSTRQGSRFRYRRCKERGEKNVPSPGALYRDEGFGCEVNYASGSSQVAGSATSSRVRPPDLNQVVGVHAGKHPEVLTTLH